MEIDGFKVVDATRPLIINISPGDAARNAGHSKWWNKRNMSDPQNCAVAMSLSYQIKRLEGRHTKYCAVHMSRVYVERGGVIVRYLTPKDLRTELITFDRGGRFQAGEYTLLPISAAIKKRNKNWRAVKARAARRGKKTKSRRVVTGVRPNAFRGKGAF